MSTQGALITIASHLLAVEVGQEQMKQDAIDRYWDACKYPRKKKKQIRKEANIDYNIACWDPFNF